MVPIALATDAANAAMNVGVQLYMAKKQRQEAEKKRLQELLLTGQQGAMQGAEEGRKNAQTALQQMLQGFTGALL